MKFDNISFATYGRSVETDRIFPKKGAGINKLYYINSGSILCKTHEKEYILEEGHLYLIPQSLEITLISQYVDHTYFDFVTTPIIINTSVIDIELSKYPMIESFFNSLNMFVQKYPMRFLQSNKYCEFVKSSLNNFFLLFNEEVSIFTVSDKVVNKAIEYIHSNYSNNISVIELADRFHMEVGSFIRRFKRYTNITPYKYIKFLRANIAAELIKEERYTLSEISSMVGYSDASSLSHAIKGINSKKYKNLS